MSRRSARVAAIIPAPAEDMSGSDAESADDSASQGSQQQRTKRTKAVSKRPAKKRKTGPRNGMTDDATDATGEEGEDGDLYQAILDADADITTLASDFLESYTVDAQDALRELVQLILNASGTKQAVTQFDIEDIETVPETLMQLQEHLTGQVRSATDLYPLVSRDKRFKVLRKQLCEFFGQIIIQCRDRKILYDSSSDLVQVLENWTVSMSSSTLRAFRHTATAICLATISALVKCHAELLRECTTMQRQQTKLQKTTQKAKLASVMRDVKAREADLLESQTMINNYFDSVFVHRYRDVDGKIRSECMRELGIWMQQLPSVFFQGTYLRYLGWILSDVNAPTRLEVVRTLTKLYEDDQFTANLRHFTSKFKERILMMALSDSDNAVRAAALLTSDKMRQRGLLEDEDVDIMLPSVLDAEVRVREAAKPFFQGVLLEQSGELVEQLGDCNSIADKDKSCWALLKSLAAIVLKIFSGQTVSAAHKHDNVYGPESAVSTAALTFLKGLQEPSLASIAGYLLQDFDADDEFNALLQPVEGEETVLLEILVAATELALVASKSNDEDEQDTLRGSILSTIPSLLRKFTDAAKVCSIARLCMLVDGNAFADARARSTFEMQLSSLAKLFGSHGEPTLLRCIGQVLLHFSPQESLARFMEDLIMDLLHETRDAILVNSANDDQDVALLRLAILGGMHDCIALFETPGSLFQAVRRASSTMNADCAALARLCLRNYVMWKVQAASKDASQLEGVQELRDDLTTLYLAQMSSGQLGISNSLVELETIFATCLESKPDDPDMLDTAKTMAQGFVKVAKQYGTFAQKDVVVRVDALHADLDDIFSDPEDEDDNEESLSSDTRELRVLRLERELCQSAALIVRAVTLKTMDASYASLLTANRGRLGTSFDRLLKELPVA